MMDNSGSREYRDETEKVTGRDIGDTLRKWDSVDALMEVRKKMQFGIGVFGLPLVRWVTQEAQLGP